MTHMFEKIKALLSTEEKLETVPDDENWEPAHYEPEVDPYGEGHEGDYRG